MTSYKFNFTTANYVLDHMNSVNTTLQNSLAELEGNCRTSLTEWDGVARDSYYQAESEWRAGFAAMAQALQSGRTSLLNISEGYGSAEQRATQIWSNTYTGR